MRAAVLVAVVALAGIVVGLTLLIVLAKLGRDRRERWRAARRAQLEPRILRYLHGLYPRIRHALPGALGRGDRPVVERVLLDRARERAGGVPVERIAAAFEDLGLVEDYLERLRSRDWWRRAEAADHLGRTGAPRVIGPLGTALDDPVSEVRLRAASALAELGGAAAIRPLLDALSQPNRWSTIRIADVLAARGESVADELIDAFPGLNLHAQLAVLDVLGDVRAERAVPFLRERLADAEPEIRARAVKALAAVGDLGSGAPMLAALHDRAWPVRALAAKSLGTLLHVPAIPELCAALRDDVWWVRNNAAESLLGFGPDGIEALEEMLDDSDTYARHQAVLMLEQAGVLDEQVDRLADAEGTARARAELMVDRLVLDGQTGRLQHLVENHPRAEVRAALAARIGHGGPQRGAGR